MPGIQTQLDALHQATAALPRVQSKGSHPVLGRTTEHAIRSGVIRGSVGAIVHCVQEIQQTKDGKNARVVLSGGNAPYVQKQLSTMLPLLPVNDLVLRGILHLLERNNKDVYGSHSPTRRSGGSAARKHVVGQPDKSPRNSNVTPKRRRLNHVTFGITQISSKPSRRLASGKTRNVPP